MIDDSIGKARAHAAEAFARHELTVLHEDGLYRHLKCARPTTNMYRFDLVTWPGHLTICGDLESFTFSRTADMVEFFAADRDINPGYWRQKLTNRDARTERYSRAKLDLRVGQALRDQSDYDPRGLLWLQAAAQEWSEHTLYVDLEDEHAARGALCDFDHDGWRFSDWWEWDLTEWDHHFLLSCFAIHRGLEMYRERQAVPA